MKCPQKEKQFGLVVEKTSTFDDDWQEMSPNRRISSKSWTGVTYFYPLEKPTNVKARIMAMTCNVQTEPSRGLDAVTSILGLSPVPAVIANERTLNPPKERRIRSGKKPVMFEFCCSKDSTLGKVNQSRGFEHFRLSRDVTDLEDPQQIASLLNQTNKFKGADLWASIPCGPWSPWQKMNLHRYGKKYKIKLAKKRKTSKKLLEHFLLVAENVIANGGHVSFEWPKQSEGWALPALLRFIKRHNMYETCCNGCALGLVDKNGEPHKKTWRVVTTSMKLAVNLGGYQCKHPQGFKHSPLEGSETSRSAFYTEKMAQVISNSLYPDASVPCMPTVPFVQSEHVPRSVPVGVHQVIDRRDWSKHPGAYEAIAKERDGLVANEVWLCDKIIPKEELLKSGKQYNLGRLMTILSVKHAESPTLRKLKARVVFRGDQIVDESNNIAILQELKVNPSGITAINFNLSYGALKGNKSTQSDVVRAYTQSLLKTKVPTWVLLPPELVPKEYSHIKDPVAPLDKALYGHPESGFHWDARFREVMQIMGGSPDQDNQSNWTFGNGLLLTLYVDDVLLSGPSHLHAEFWKTLSGHLEIEPPTEVDRCLGRKHIFHHNEDSTEVEFDMVDFIQSSCDFYVELAGKPLKEASSPYLPEGSLPLTEWESRGELSGTASRVLMKILWCARLCRPDIQKAIADLTRRVTCWSTADDKRLYRLMSYLWTTKDFKLRGKIADRQQDLKLVLYTDADHASAVEDAKSSSGSLLCLEGPNSYWPLSWSSKRQGATSRSTTEAEVISLASGVFDALPTLEFIEKVYGREVEMRCMQDNTAVIAICNQGYSPKLRHVSKHHRINLGSLYEVFSSGIAKLMYIKTTSQRADPFTKPLAVGKWPHALHLLGIKPKHPSLETPIPETSLEHAKGEKNGCG